MMDVTLLEIALGLACFLICAYFFFELHYFGRSLLCVILAKCKRKIHILDEVSVQGICLSTDIDTLLTHMNNARFLRELDFAKIDFFERSGLFQLIRKYKGTLCMGATTVRYRRFIRLFSLYKISSKIIYWDNLSIFMEHRFISSSDNFISAIVVCRTRIANCDVEAMMEEALKVPEGGNIEDAKREKPQLTTCLQKWIEHNELSSAMLRSNQNNAVNDKNGIKNSSNEVILNTKFIKEVNGNVDISKETNGRTNKLAVENVGCTNPTFKE